MISAHPMWFVAADPAPQRDEDVQWLPLVGFRASGIAPHSNGSRRWLGPDLRSSSGLPTGRVFFQVSFAIVRGGHPTHSRVLPVLWYQAENRQTVIGIQLPM